MKTLSGIRAAGAAMVLGGVAATATAAWQPGLWGGFHTRGASDFASPPIYTNVFSDTHCATNWNGGTSNTDSPDIIWSNNRVWSYWGQIYLPATNVTFGQAIDDMAILYIDGLKILNQVASNCSQTTVTTNYTTAGWHDFMFQASNGGGGAGPMSSGNGLGDGIGFGVKFGDDTAWSYMADDGNMSRYRHDDGLGFDDTFRVTGVPSNFGAPVPFYGTYAGVANGSNLTMSVASGSGYVTASDTQRACCTGYVWYAVDSVSSTKTVVQGGADTSFAYSHNNMAEIAWHWKVENLVTVTAGTGGSVSTNGGWLDAGATIEVTAIDGDAFFLCWLGDIDEAQRTSRTITITADQARTVTAHFGNEIFVSPAGSDSNGGTSWEDAKKTIADAVAIASLINVSNGTYTVASQITLDKPVTIRGVGRSPLEVVVRFPPPSNGQRIFELNHPMARIENLTSSGGHLANTNGGNILFSSGGGTVSNCVICNCQVDWFGHGAVYLGSTAALLTGCVISNNVANNVNSKDGFGVTIADGRVENCLITGNYDNEDQAPRTHNGAVYISGGEMINCTIVNNASRQVAGVQCTGGAVVNCVIYGNRSTVAGGIAAVYGGGKPECFTNCASDVAAINETCVTGLFNFADPERGDWRPQCGSICIDGGTADVVDLAPLDLDGAPRLSANQIDIGCYEAPWIPPGTMLLLQ